MLPPDLDESVFDHEPVRKRVLLLAEAKARAVAAAIGTGNFPIDSSSRWVLAADTLVHVPMDEDIVLGKPSDEEDARRMLRLLAGREHLVHTGLALLDRDANRLFPAISESRVKFAELCAEELDAYILAGDWRDVAGAYKIQGQAARYIERIEGSWSGIVGLPIRELYVILAQSGFGRI